MLTCLFASRQNLILHPREQVKWQTTHYDYLLILI